jgi:sugar lactone lactonase YvrE
MSILGYDLTAEGRLSNKRLVYKFPTYTVDGIMFDEHGRLWVARWLHGTVDVLDVEEGKLVASYKMGGDRVTNLCFKDTSAYVTVAGRHSIERLDVGVRGATIIPGLAAARSQAQAAS